MIWHPTRRYRFSARFFLQIFIDLQISFSSLRHARYTRDVFCKKRIEIRTAQTGKICSKRVRDKTKVAINKNEVTVFTRSPL